VSRWWHLLHGAAGGVGSIRTQMAGRDAAAVLATVGDTAQIQAAQQRVPN
jgi:NADPH:quinone reductase-like Zn-dependent oxidoreductase